MTLGSTDKGQDIRIVPLGAGREVGRSCILVSIGRRNILLDCGIHMGFTDSRKYPDFSYLLPPSPPSSSNGNDPSSSATGNTPTGESLIGKSVDGVLDAVIISHFHLDHCGALPYLTEKIGFSGPVYMTHPTRSICPLLLEDMRKIAAERKGDADFYSARDIQNCMAKVIPVSLHETVIVGKPKSAASSPAGSSQDEDALPPIRIKAYYAGHVLGAGMFHIQVGDSASVVYTGDYNMTPDRHLGSAWIDACQPDVLITETTYANYIRDSRRARERDFLKKVHDCVQAGGKVLIPVFALGRAQELCILIESYWERMKLDVPVFFSAGLTERANEYYKLYLGWTNEKIKRTFVERNMFDFAHIRAWESSMLTQPGPMVLFASPGMLHAGTSLNVFKHWCHDPKNTVILPGYCVAGTVGAKVLAGQKTIAIDKHTSVDVQMDVQNLSFSAHADAKGIMDLIRMARPRHVMLVHGEASKMLILKSQIESELGIPTFDPANGQSISLSPSPNVPIQIPKRMISESHNAERQKWIKKDSSVDISCVHPIQSLPVHALCVPATSHSVPARLVPLDHAAQPVEIEDTKKTYVKRFNPFKFLASDPKEDNVKTHALKVVMDHLKQWMGSDVQLKHIPSEQSLIINGQVEIEMSPEPTEFTLTLSWPSRHQGLAVQVLAVLNSCLS